MNVALNPRLRNATETAIDAEIAALLARVPDPARERARRDFAAAGLPTRRQEAWHYSDLRAAMKSFASLAPAPDEAAVAVARKGLEAGPRHGETRLVLLDGHFQPALSDARPSGVMVGTPVRAATECEAADGMLAATTALAAAPLVIDVDGDAEAHGSLEIVHLASGGARAVASHIVLTLAPGAKVRLIERFLGAEGGQRLARFDVRLGDGAELVHVGVVDEASALHVESQRPTLARGSRYQGFALVAEGAFVRRQIFAALDGADAKLALCGLSLIDGTRHADTTLEVTHAATGGESREFYRHIVADEGVGVYQGKVIVNPGAQKTDGAMKSQAVLLSPTAQMMNKPELEIFADDVVCGHGATVAALDPEQVFYLQSRAIPRAEAEAMVLEAFGAEAIGRVEDEALREPLLAAMRAWLAKRGRAA